MVPPLETNHNSNPNLNCPIAYGKRIKYILFFSIWSVHLDTSPGTECGKSAKLGTGSQILLTTNGKTETGYCGFLINRIQDPNTKCVYPGMCARIDDSKMSSCQSKVAFTGKYFDKTPDSTQVQYRKKLDLNYITKQAISSVDMYYI
jgi:hypothetical protein